MMKSDFVKQPCIGIHCHEQPERLHATLESVRRNTASMVQLILLPDGPDARMRQALRSLNDIPQYGSEVPAGTAACFNRLAQFSDADVVILLESSAQVGPGWLDHLLRALDADPRNGLAGPSTNQAWNEQGVYPKAGSAWSELARSAADAFQKFGSEVRTLEPLFSLADFCYAVKREVIEAVGAADQNYSTGPCWEMDYNIRAARAGWRGVWACASYVHRAPFTVRRRLEENRRFETNKRRYQDKFCGARLRGEKTDYRMHCRGSACPNFAPAELIEIKRPFSSTPKPVAPPLTIDSPAHEEPLVTCIMPTHNRRSFIPQAIRCFLRQDYPNLELLIVDDGTDVVRDCVPESERIRYFRLDQKQTIGAKRNFACAQARGEFIAHWDDDDWYPTWRIRAQVDALLERGADLCGSSRILYYAIDTDQAWEYRYSNSNGKWVAGSTLAYRKDLWARNNFPDVQIGEDSRFVWSNASRTVCDLADPTLCVATAHAGNTSRKDTNGSYWYSHSREELDALLGDDIYFYRFAVPGAQVSRPLVSCIMPTYNRRSYVPQALQSFLQQDYPNRELIVVDDGSDPIGDLTKGLPNVRYFRVPRTSIGAKRNIACQHAQGQIIAHWDDDDWYSPDRLRYQLTPILTGIADVTGLESAFVLELPACEFWTTQPHLHQKIFAGNIHGGTIVYRRELWSQGTRYPEVNLAEDAWLLRRAIHQGRRLVRLSNPGVFIYVRHGGNAWKEFAPGQFIDPAGWKRISAPLNFPAATLEFFKGACIGR